MGRYQCSGSWGCFFSMKVTALSSRSESPRRLLTIAGSRRSCASGPRGQLYATIAELARRAWMRHDWPRGAKLDCQACGNPNPEDARFCGACGAAVGSPEACPSCGAAIAPEQHFCNACGARLDRPEEAASTPPAFDLSEYRPAHLAE